MKTIPLTAAPIGKPGTGRVTATIPVSAAPLEQPLPVIFFDKRAGYETLISARGGTPLPQGPVFFDPLRTGPANRVRPVLAACEVADAFGIAGVRS